MLPAAGLSDAEEARAAEIEARIVAEERAAEDVRRRGRDRARAASEPVARLGTGTRGASSLLAGRAAEEYTYVQRDVRRIATVGGSMLGVLILLFVLIEVAHVVSV
ncbi:MAG TPA: hypothetical protein VF763_01930 [Candidatus Limnocylindrales bacterium]